MTRFPVVLVFVLALAGSLQAVCRAPLSFEERVKAQEAIERVYYDHRIWPKENPGPKPAFEHAVPKAQIVAKVADYLKKCAALDVFWQQPIAPEQLQAELDRMVRDSQDPASLRDLFSALGNDPEAIAECLARPVLADRLLRGWYSRDDRFHGELKRRAETAYAAGSGSWNELEGAVMEERARIRSEEGEGLLKRPGERGTGEIRLTPEEFSRWLADAPASGATAFRDADEGFLLVYTKRATATRWEGTTCYLPKRPFSKWWNEIRTGIPAVPASVRENVRAGFSLNWEKRPAVCTLGEGWVNNRSLLEATTPPFGGPAVWTGSEMLVWEGYGSAGYSKAGGRYNPSTDTWASMSSGANCPEGRDYFTAVWTGTEAIVWGGARNFVALNDGGRYNPVSDSWEGVSIGAGSPSDRYVHTAVWTGSEMVVWGGYNGSAPLRSGGRYNPLSNSWISTSVAAGCPLGRYFHSAVWTGSEMVVWGGYGETSPLASGGRYNPSADTWQPTAETPGCPSPRDSHTAIWTGTEMIVWGGADYSVNPPIAQNSGGRYNPAADSWTAVSTGGNCPSARFSHSAVWSGTEMILWGGQHYSSGTVFHDDGARYRPADDTWAGVDLGAGHPSSRSNHGAVWTGTEMLIWGGGNTSQLNTGSRYDPSTDTWLEIGSTHFTPSARRGHTAVWTGGEMVVWGGFGSTNLNTGGVYDPALDTWTPTSTGTYCPTARTGHEAVWTGSEMVVWGGAYYFPTTADPTQYPTAGGRYSPAADTWAPMAEGASCPPGRVNLSAVWTGTQMIVWGGYEENAVGWLNTGGIYTPASDTWTPTSTGVDCPSGREQHSAIWTGMEMVVWGGAYADYSWQYLNTGGRYNPATDTWRPTSTGSGCPLGRRSHTGVWTETEMLIWGGYRGFRLGDGSLYDPIDDSWSPMSSGTNCPSARYAHASVWTGSELIVWGGYGTTYLTTGGRYFPILDAWAATPAGPYCPTARTDPTVVWTGAGMILWGGWQGANTNTGGFYLPEVPVWGPASVCAGSQGVLLTTAYESYQWRRNGEDIPGAILQNYTATESGSYQVRVTDSAGCVRTSPSHEVAFPPPPAPVVAGAELGCETTGVALSTDLFGAYQWLKDGAEIPGATLQAYMAYATGNYSVSVVDANGCTGQSAEHPVTVLSSAPPAPTIEGSGTGCRFPGALLSTQSYSSYQWAKDSVPIPGATSQSFLATQDGSYTVSVTDGIGCQGVSEGVPVALQENPFPILYGPAATETLLYAQDFEGASLPGGWAAFNNGGDCVWSTSQALGVSNLTGGSGGAAVADSDRCGSGTTMNTALVSPSFDLSDPQMISAELQFKTDFNDYLSSDHGYVDVSVDGLNWSNVLHYDRQDFRGPRMEVLNLTPYLGQSEVRVRFVYTAPGWDWWWQVDEVRLVGHISSASCGTPGVPLSTDPYPSYQWVKDGEDIPGATSSSYTVTQSGSFAVRVMDELGCQGISLPRAVSILPTPSPTVSGPGCFPALLRTEVATAYSWYRNGTAIPGATDQTYFAQAPGAYRVRATGANGCYGVSADHTVRTAPAPTVSGAVEGCGSVALSTQAFSAYQWHQDGVDIPGATGQTYQALSNGAFSVTVTDGFGCQGTSQAKSVAVHPAPAPIVTGPFVNDCPGISVVLSIPAGYVSYQWALNGTPLPGATQTSLTVSVTGYYSAAVVDAFGCSGNSDFHPVFIDFCPDSEVSPWGAIYPARLVKDAASPTGYYLYFQRLDTLDGYNLYEGDLGSPLYSHASAVGNQCGIAPQDLGTGEMRIAITPSEGSHYYLVTAFGSGVEGPSGFDSQGLQIPESQSTCGP